MSYADVCVDLSSVAVACLSGHNGSGKSALLDAVTWALWEEGRSSSDELIRLGQKEMWVDLIFDYEGRTYRVRRSRLKRASKSGKTGASKGTLDLQLLASVGARSLETRREEESLAVAAGARSERRELSRDNDSVLASGVDNAIASHPRMEETDGLGHWRSLTGATMRATQQSICDLLRMDYDTFVNSAYLRQGRADEFTTRPPSERKQVLSEILGLAYFDRLQEACRLRARDGKTKIELIENSLLSLPELEREGLEVASRLEIERVELKSKEGVLRELEALVSTLTQTVQNLKLKRQHIDDGASQLEELRADVEGLLRQRAEMERRHADLSQMVERAPEIEVKSVELEKAKAEVESLDRKALSAQGLSEEKLRLQSQLASIRSRLEVELDHFKDATESCRRKTEALRNDTRDGDKTQAAYADFKKLLTEEASLAQKQDTFTRLTERANLLQSMVTEAKIKLEAEIGQKELTLTELEQVISAENLVAEQKQALEEEVRELERVESEFELVEEKGMLMKTELESIDVKVEEVKRRQEENREKVRELTEHRHESICPLCAAPIVDRLAVINRYKVDNDSLDSDINSLLKSREELEDERNELRVKYMQLKREMSRRNELDKRIGQFNEKQNTIERARESRARTVKEILLLERRLDEMEFAQIERESLINVKTEIHKLEFDPAVYASLQSQIRAKRHIESRHVQLKKDMTELERLEKELPVLLERETKCLEELESESYGEELRSELKSVKEALEVLNYDRERHQFLKSQLIELLPFVEQVRDLKKAQDELPAVQDSLEQLTGRLESKQTRIPELEADIETLKEVTGELNEKQFFLEQRLEQLDKIRAEHQVLALAVAVCESRNDQIIRELEQLAERKIELVRLIEEREDHIFLAESFGKKGIQAVIIENAVPELESEANRILARLSDNKMHVALVTQQKTKSGNLAETLDILIGDEIGTRNYELYSGGEAFKVNFAIRIALSRLLARRAGARLETLVIDEGFGSQDDQSRERLVSAIKSIQTDFRKILVITHIADVREMFPVQIQVQKESGVSRLQVVS